MLSNAMSSLSRFDLVRQYGTGKRELLLDYEDRFVKFKCAALHLGCYCKGAKIWVPHAESVWEEAEIQEDYKSTKLKIIFDNKRQLEIVISKDEDLPPLRNPDILIGENDLTSLSYLHEPAVLHNLKHRFCTLYTIYTYCGIVLVAINPYDELQIYDNDTIWTYRGRSQGDLDPHIFAVAEEAYAKIERENRDQSIIVSGESGAGKTVSAKYVMRYFATVGGSSEETQVEKKVLASSPIMEAIGNAKTTRNDNSSRFGKFIEIKFNKNYNIIGASMRTYLLEKSRVVFQAGGERNYHIFYQLCSVRDRYPHLYLDHQDKFVYLNQGDSPYVDCVDDKDSFSETLEALNMLGFRRSEQDNLFKIMSAVLHLGNVKIHDAEDGCSIKKSDRHLDILCKLLEVDVSEMRTWLCTRRIVSMKEVFNKPMTSQQAVSSKEALSKHIYSQLFSWIVCVINKALMTSSDKSEHRFIGVLDIYGFETFEINSFEQFCINYANEKLQQQFNQHVFKLEQEEYLKEEIEWKFIDFYDNQPCIDLIESKLGILDLLDEECRMPKGTDNTWAEKLYQSCIKYKHFAKPRFGTSSFLIHHFADNVEYQVDGFLDKNRDTVSEEQINVLCNSQNEFLQSLLLDAEKTQEQHQKSAKVKLSVGGSGKPQTSSGKHTKKTVGSQFRDSLNMLMKTLNSTTPHYVRCIKPNDLKKPFDYNPQRAVQQLRACGVLETIRISAAGFPSRWQYVDFFVRYRVLCKFKDINRTDMKLTCQNVLSNYIKDCDKYQFGKTKIFFRAGQVAFLEKVRADRLKFCCIMIQKQIRAFIARKRYTKLQRSVMNIQRYGRGLLARRHALFLRQTRSAITIQRYVRGWVKRKRYNELRLLAVRLQARSRGLLARRRYQHMRFNKAACVIQRHARGFLARRRYARETRRIVTVQSICRVWLAKRQFRMLKKEARTVEHVKKLNKGLENKIISLQHKIDEVTKENSSMKSLHSEVLELRTKVEILKQLELDAKKNNVKMSDYENQMKKLNEMLKCEQNEKMDLLQEKELLNNDLLMIREENVNMKLELDEINEKLKMNSMLVDEKSKVDQEKNMLAQEVDQQMQIYQKLLAAYNILESRNEQLEKTVIRLTNKDKNNRSNVEFDNDVGYSSVKSASGTGSNDSSELSSIVTLSSESLRLSDLPEIDIGLVLKLQQKLKDVEWERDMLFHRVESLEKEDSPSEEKARTVDNIRLTELEMENEKLKTDLATLRDSLAMGDPGTKELLNQFRASENELVRRRDEIIQLRAVLATQTRGLKNIAKINYGSSNDVNLEVLNEDGELVTAFDAQRRINRQLEDELQQEKLNRKQEREESVVELGKLKEELEKQQKLLSNNLNKSPQSQMEAYMKHEISRLLTENLNLQEKYDGSQDTCRKLKRLNKRLLQKLREAGVDSTDQQDLTTSGISPGTNRVSSKMTTSTSAPPVPAVRNQLPNIMMKKERKYQGMFEYRRDDETAIVKHLVFDLKPRQAMQLLPGLPAYIFFMCIRHTDLCNDDQKVRSLLTAFINSVRKVIKKRHNDLETKALWLANTLRLLHCLKQYSGDRNFQKENTQTQNEQCLRNFDLSQYRQVLSDMAIWIYQGIVRDLQEKIKDLIVPAVLENQAITGLPQTTPEDKNVHILRPVQSPEEKNLERLQNELTSFYKILAVFSVDPEVIVQVFRQLFYFIMASALNNLLLRKDLCNFSSGLQIRYNLSHLEQWLRDEKLNDQGIADTLQPIIQASQLLQARKLPEDVNNICDMCDKLTLQQIVKLLHYYTPVFEGEERVGTEFIKNVKLVLQSRQTETPTTPSGSNDAGKVLMDTKFLFSVRFLFNPSSVRLEDIEIPDSLELPVLNKV